MKPKIGVLQFPGSLDEEDTMRAIKYVDAEPIKLWHKDTDLQGVEAVIIPGGFSYGDYLRAGAIASFAPIMQEIKSEVKKGLPVLGICNGFQILCEAGLLPGALLRNESQKFICQDQWLSVENNRTVFTNAFEKNAEILIPIKNMDGRFIGGPDLIKSLEDNDQVVFRYVEDNPNGSINDIAGVCSQNNKVVGLMPHPEHAIDPLTGPSTDGLGLFVSLLADFAKV